MTSDVDIWSEHGREWRSPAQVVAQWEEAGRVPARTFANTTSGDFWGLLDAADLTLLVSREYEHLLMALSVDESRPVATYLRLPHPSGVVFDADRGTIFVASTRNPNQIYELEPTDEGLLLPRRTSFFPGSLYLHDLALVDGDLHANAVGQNAVIRVERDAWSRVWWPRSIDGDDGPRVDMNYLQLNSIAAGPTLDDSFFSASAETPGTRRPGHVNFPVDGRGVIFSGRTREPVVRGLTRPHSARLRDDVLWVANSGYGELSRADGAAAHPTTRLPGWTRGLCFAGDVAFVATSRVIPRFRAYAPGLDVNRSICGVHAVDVRSGTVLGNLTWTSGNQIFAVEAVPRPIARALPFSTAERAHARAVSLFSTFSSHTEGG